MKQYIKAAMVALSVFVFAVYSNIAAAALYDVTGVLSGSDGGFGFSGFHYAGDLGSGIDGDGDPMTGTALVDIPAATGLFGTYDDASGDFYVQLATNFVYVPTFELEGVLLFDNYGFLDPGSTLTITFNTTTILGDLSTNMVFDAGQVCCSGSNSPNSFAGNIMSLWGANSTPELDPFFPDNNAEVLGLDLRIQLTPVPVPAAFWLFATGLLGLAGLVRRKG